MKTVPGVTLLHRACLGLDGYLGAGCTAFYLAGLGLMYPHVTFYH